MKYFLVIAVCLISLSVTSQNNHIVKTEDGRRVLLKADYTWEYIDIAKPKKTKLAKTKISKTKALKPVTNIKCNLTEDFSEPSLDKKVQTQLKRGRATIDHIKKKVAKDFKCNEEDVILLSANESVKSGTYHFCVNGNKVIYKRNGYSVAKKLKVL